MDAGTVLLIMVVIAAAAIEIFVMNRGERNSFEEED